MAGFPRIFNLVLVTIAVAVTIGTQIQNCSGHGGSGFFDSKDGVDIMKKLVNATSTVFNESGIRTGAQPDDPIILKHPLDIIIEYGYPSAEEVNITTNDGYILTLWRIKCPKNVKTCLPRRPALLQHGLMLSGADWLFVDEDAILPLRLAEEYDVYIGNSRGNRYSRGHLEYDLHPNSSYWKFSVHEMAVEDLPATIGYMLKESGFPSINYVGYSMGTTMFYILMSEKFDEYNEKINKVLLMAPALVIDGLGFTSRSPLSKLLVLKTVKRTVISTVLLGLITALVIEDGPVPDPDAPGKNETVTALQLMKIFNIPQPRQTMSQTLLGYLLTEGASAIKNPTAVLRGIGHAQGGGSLRTIRHFVQFYKSGKFRRYQYQNPAKNCQEYGSVSPPHYNMTLFGSRALILAGGNDSLVVLSDAKKTALKTIKGSKCLPNMCVLKDFTHMDFVYGNSTEVKNGITEVALLFFKDGHDFKVEEDCYELQVDETWNELKQLQGNCSSTSFAQQLRNNITNAVKNSIVKYYNAPCKMYERIPTTKLNPN